MTVHPSAQRLRIRTDWFRPQSSAPRRFRFDAFGRVAAAPPRLALHATILGISTAAALAALLA